MAPSFGLFIVCLGLRQTAITIPTIASSSLRWPFHPLTSGHLRAMPSQELTQQRAVATALVLTIAADRDVRALGKRRQQPDQALCRGFAHLTPVSSLVDVPTPRRQRLRERVRDERRAWSQLGQPDIEVIASGPVPLAHRPRRTPNGAAAQSLAFAARSSQPYDAQGHRVVPLLVAGYFSEIIGSEAWGSKLGRPVRALR